MIRGYFLQIAYVREYVRICKNRVRSNITNITNITGGKRR